MSNTQTIPRCKNLVLDAGPLLSLSPLRNLAEIYLTVPQVLEELKDHRAREHFERLGLSAGVQIEVRSPDAGSLAHVIQFAKKTGDYSVLSHADLCVLALTYEIQQKEQDCREKVTGQKALANADISATTQSDSNASKEDSDKNPSENQEHSSIDQKDLPQTQEEGISELVCEELPEDQEEYSEGQEDYEERKEYKDTQEEVPSLYEDPSDDDDGEGEWITATNVALHKSRALDLLPSAGSSLRKGKSKEDQVVFVGCMTADFAMQNVLLQMELSLVGVEGKKIQRLKSWVLRCHACFKICKDNSRKFCPSCGNPTLLRTSVTISAPSASADTPVMQVHLKPNFQYRIRGTKYSIPAPKPGSAKTGPGEGLILREDQTEYLRAKKLADGKREREEKKMLKGLVSRGTEAGTNIGSWMDPDWMPEIISAGPGGKGRNQKVGGRDGDMPVIGYGRRNPNESKRRKK